MTRLILVAVIVAAILILVPALAAQRVNVDVYGRTLPTNAAPYQMQVWQELCDASAKETTLSSAVSVYQRICDQDGFDKLGDALVSLDENLNLIPAAAESWDVSSDGLTWHFHLRHGQVWSDGTPLTAADYVATYRYMVDPKNAYDFVWMWNGVIAGWDQAAAGEIPADQIGVSAADALTLDVKTQSPIGFLPSTLLHWAPMQAAALAKYGSGSYMLDPKTSVSSGPFILQEFVPGKDLILEANPTYNGYRKPYLREIRGIYGNEKDGSFLAFQNHDVDRVNYANMTPADFQVVNSDPLMQKDYLPNMGDFRTDYLFFDTDTPPFDKSDVRLAFAKALDRDSIVKNVIGSQVAMAATSLLAPGFPDWDANGDFKSIQAYNCPAAKALLTQAGYDNGVGFPAVELKLRGETDAVAARFIAAAASISSCLNVQVTVNNMDYASYMTDLLAQPTRIQFGAISDGADYLDPNAILGQWVSPGRHAWQNADFDRLVKQARSETDATQRAQEYHDAEKLLVTDAGGIFLDWRIQGDLFQPYVAGGDCFKANAEGSSAWHWGNDFCWGALYITQDVENVDTYRTRSS